MGFMKGVSIILFLGVFLLGYVDAVTYYLDATNGNDYNSGLSTSSPWKSLSKLNSEFSSGNIGGGDMILFRSGEVWTGQISVRNVGSQSGNIISFGAYGSGARPVINGAETVNPSSWNLFDKTNIPHLTGVPWLFYTQVSFPVTQVFVDGNRMQLARHPNEGYFTYTSRDPVSGRIISDDNTEYPFALSGTDGVKVVIKHLDWCLDMRDVTGFTHTSSKSDFTYSPAELSFESVSSNANGFFIMNSLVQIDSPGEWYYDSNEGRLYLAALGWTENLLNRKVELSRYNYGIYVDGSCTVSVNIENLELKNFVLDSIIVSNNRNFNMLNTKISNSGRAGILFMDDSQTDGYFTIKDSIIENSAYSGLIIYSPKNITIYNNTIKNNGLAISQIQQTGCVVFNNILAERITPISGSSNKIYILNNNLLNSGGPSILINDEFVISSNYIDGFCSLIQDCGGIYYSGFDTFPESNKQVFEKRIIEKNTIKNGIGNLEGVFSGRGFMAPAIYLDLYASNVIIRKNDISNVNANSLVFLNGGNYNLVYKNNLNEGMRDVKSAIAVTRHNQNIGSSLQPYAQANDNMFFSNDILFSGSSDRFAFNFQSITSDDPNFGKVFSNEYFSNSKIRYTYRPNYGSIVKENIYSSESNYCSVNNNCDHPDIFCDDADSNLDGVVSINELISSFSEWKLGRVIIGELINTIGKWKNGC